MRPCRCLLCLGLVGGVVLSHDPPHAHVPAPGEQVVWFGKAAIVRNSTNSGGGGGDVVVRPGTGELTWEGFAPMVTVTSADS